ncbi:MAG: hypothetical protein AB1805_04865 [Nitrospirota bacterium]
MVQLHHANYKRLLQGSLMGAVGYLLSPLSPWNDVFLNIPLAYFGAWVASLVCPAAFLPAFIIAYWITNIAGLVILHKGAETIVRKEGGSKPYTRRDVIRDLALSAGYTVLIVLLVKLEVIRSPGEYF